jgi:hypothetical protein
VCVGAAFYFGIQTDVSDPKTWKGLGKGLIFSTWWTFDLADLRLAEERGFYQQGTHEGKFIGVRRLYDWTAGRYLLTLERTEPERGGDWFTLSITWLKAFADSAGSTCTPTRRATTPVLMERTVIGSLRFPRRKADVPATIRADGISFLEVYSNAAHESEIADWALAVAAFGDGKHPLMARSEYPKWPYAEVSCTDAYLLPSAPATVSTAKSVGPDAGVDGEHGGEYRVKVTYGQHVERIHPPTTLFNHTAAVTSMSAVATTAARSQPLSVRTGIVCH